MIDKEDVAVVVPGLGTSILTSGSDSATELGPLLPLVPLYIAEPREYNEENDMRFDSVSPSDFA